MPKGKSKKNYVVLIDQMTFQLDGGGSEKMS